MKTNLWRLVTLGLVIMLAACSTNPPVLTPTPVNSPTATPRPATASPTPNPTYDIDAMVTRGVATYSAKLTRDAILEARTPSRTPIPSQTPTLTPAAMTPLVKENTPFSLTNFALSSQNAGQVVELTRMGKGNVNDIAYTPDGALLAIASSLGIYFYDDTQQLVDTIETGEPVLKLAFSPDGQTLVTLSETNLLLFWKWEDHTVKTITPPGGGDISDLTYSPSGDSVAFIQPTGPNSSDPFIFILGVKDGKTLRQIPLASLWFNNFQYAPDGRSIYVTGATINQYRIADGSIQNSWASPYTKDHEMINNLAITNDGKKMIASNQGSVYLWNLQDAAPYQETEKIPIVGFADHSTYKAETCTGFAGSSGGVSIYDYTISPDNNLFAVATSFGSFQIRRMSDFTLVAAAPEKSPHGGAEAFTSTLMFNPKRPALAVLYTTGLVEIFDIPSLHLAGSVTGHVNGYTSVTISPALPGGNYYLAAGASDNLLRIWTLPDGKQATILQFQANSVAFSPRGDYLAFGSRDWTVNLLRLADGSLLGPQSGHQDWVDGVAVSPDSKTLISGSEDCTLKIWQIGNRLTLQRTITNTSFDGFYQIVLSPDGTWVAGSINYSETPGAYIYNIQTGQLQFLAGPTGWFAFSPDSRTLAIISNKLSFWDLATMSKTREAGLSGRWVTYSPDGSLLAVASGGLITLVDAQTLVVLKVLKGHVGFITGLAFSPDGKFLASASDDGTIRVWGVAQ